jgi:hypothetical protein
MGKIITAKSSTKSPKEIIPGGRAKGKSPKDFDPKQIAMGVKVELEHTGDRDMAREIAMDHLAEIPDYYTRLLRMESRAKVANAPPELISQRKFQSADAKIFLFLALYANRQYLIRVDVSSSVGFRLLASGPKAASAFRSLGDLIPKGEDLYSSGFTESPASPSETESLFRSVTQGKFAVKFPTEDNDPEAEHFFTTFKQFLREWTLNGSGNEKQFPILHHPYWERYLQSLHDSLRSKHGSSVTLYRGIHGDFVDEITDIAPVYQFSSWTADKAIAKDFARYGFIGDLQSGFAEKVKRKGKWAVISTKVPIESIVMAPVFVEALKEPELLVKRLAGQEEYVVDSPNLMVRVRVVSRSKV